MFIGQKVGLWNDNRFYFRWTIVFENNLALIEKKNWLVDNTFFFDDIFLTINRKNLYLIRFLLSMDFFHHKWVFFSREWYFPWKLTYFVGNITLIFTRAPMWSKMSFSTRFSCRKYLLRSSSIVKNIFSKQVRSSKILWVKLFPTHSIWFSTRF